MKNTREKVLHALAASQTATISQLAEQVAVNPITIRHHLNNLEAENLITRSEIRHGVGRPRMVYRLTEQGAKRFPVSFQRLSENLLGAIKTLYGPDASRKALEIVGMQMAEDYLADLPTGSTEETLKEFARKMALEGFQIQWELRGNLVTIHNSSCPFHQLSQTHPEICQLDHTLFESILKKDLKYKSAIVGGNLDCTFQFEV